jgi:hypothetical protein
MPLKELEDYNWFPRIFRQMQMHYIGEAVVLLNSYKPLQQLFAHIFNKHNYINWSDCCSGSGAPALALHKNSTKNISISLSDKYPIEASIQQQDLLKMSFSSNNMYTIFNAFHHFNKQSQSQVIANAQEANAKLVIVEVLKYNIWGFIQVFLLATIGQWLLTPFMKKLNWQQLLFTYLIPINVLTVLYDGILSVWASKSCHSNLHALSKSFPNYLQYQTLKSTFFTTIYKWEGMPK